MGPVAASTRTHRAFGLKLRCAFPLPELPVAAIDALDVEVELTSHADVGARFSGSRDPAAVHMGAVGERESFRIERGVASDLRIDYVDRAAFFLSPDGRRLLCAPVDFDSAAWRRFLLDTVLATVALAHGYEAFHAAAFEWGGGAVAVVGDQGAGKSTLLSEALVRGARFVNDDILCVSRDPGTGRYSAHPGPPVMNLASSRPHGAGAVPGAAVLATFGDESWLSLAHAATEPSPIAAFVLLDRGAGPLGVTPVEPNPRMLLQHSLVSGRAPDRLGQRFAVCADLATDVALLRLSAATDDPPGDVFVALAAALDVRIPSLGSATP